MNAAVSTVKIPRLTVSDIFAQYKWLILGENTYGVDTRIDAVGKRKINNSVFTAVRNGGLCHILSQSVQSASLSACQKHGNDFFFYMVHNFASRYFLF